MAHGDDFSPKDKITAAKIGMERSMPFLGRVVYGLDVAEMTAEDEEAHKKSSGHRKPTAHVDARGNLRWHADFVKDLTLQQTGGLLAHEIFHIVDDHIRRGRDKRGPEWTMAQEVKADWFVGEMGLPLPTFFQDHGVHVDNGTAYMKMGDKLLSVPNVDKWSVEQIHSFIKQKTNDDENMAKMIGELAKTFSDTVDNGGEGQAGGMTEDDLSDLSTTNWKKLLFEAFTPLYRGRRSFRKVHKRSQVMGFVMPGYTREGARLVIHIDTSGSVIPSIHTFYSEIKSIIGSWKKVSVDILLCDCGKIKERDSIHVSSTRDLPEKLEVGHMGGGTSHRPVVDWVMENAPDTKVLVSLTDGMSDIQQCYPRLPGTMRKVIALPSDCAYMRDKLDKHVDMIIDLPEEKRR